ncbi:MAG: 7,8-dihydro-6-hydroxymethylpterin-pyrophosphokinae [Pseudomonadota bacterium]|jgi:2-amino-4-hydroxy-6-hydroxymethyldihydropteridine diphosphokinase
MQTPFDCYVGLGSNLYQPIQQIIAALALLKTLPETTVIKNSYLYCNPPMLSVENPDPQPDYVNAAAWIQTTLTPDILLTYLQKIEIASGRQRSEKKWSSRTLDLDILLYGNLQINLPHLVIPHRGILERAFVLIPLHDCNPHLILPTGIPIKAFITPEMQQQLTRID